MIYFFTGQPGSGKTTLAKALMLRFCRGESVHIDGDDLRAFTKNSSYDKIGRVENMGQAFLIASFLSSKGFTVIISMVAPYRSVREFFKSKNDVLEIYLVSRIKRGKEHYFFKGYEPPLHNFLEIDTTSKSIEDCLSMII